MAAGDPALPALVAAGTKVDVTLQGHRAVNRAGLRIEQREDSSVSGVGLGPPGKPVIPNETRFLKRY